MNDNYRLHADLMVSLAPRGRVRLSVPFLGIQEETEPYFAKLLDRFDRRHAPDGTNIDAVLKAFPFQKKESRVFLERCMEEGLLLPVTSNVQAERRAKSEVTFFQTPSFEASAPPAFAFLGIPYDGAVTGQPGARFGPPSVRSASGCARYQVDLVDLRPVGFADLSCERPMLGGITLADAGDVVVMPAEGREEVFARATAAVQEIIDVGTLPLVIGGDHSITHAVVAALANGPLQILHLDAHTDLGEFSAEHPLHHGNVMRAILQEFKDVTGIVQVGLRGLLDPSCLEMVDGVQRMGVETFRKKGVAALMELLEPGIPTYVSLDIDVLDPSIAPTTGTPVAGGLWLHEVKAILSAVGRGFDVVGADVVEVAGVYKPSDQTASAALMALMTLADAIVTRARDQAPD